VLPPHSADKAMGLIARRRGDAVVLSVSGDLDLDNVGPLAAALSEAREQGRDPVVVDLSQVAFADSTTVNVLLQAHAELAGTLCLAQPSAFVSRLFGVIGLEQAMPVYASVEEALASRPGGTDGQVPGQGSGPG
jgi:anti-sigma B factor antagonist